jgi:hypothetical protein
MMNDLARWILLMISSNIACMMAESQGIQLHSSLM